MWSSVNVFWGILLYLLGLLNKGESAFIRVYNGSLDNYLVADLSQAEVIFSEPSWIDRNKPTVMYTFGFQGKTGGPATTTMLQAYIDTGKRNVLLLDWEEEAKSSFLGTQLSYALCAVPNAKRIGIQLGEVLVKFNLTDIHLIAHSLGAHLMGNAGRTTRSLGYPVPRITGLDPARPLFEGMFKLQRGLDRTSAKFVDIVHTSPPNSYGIVKPTGTVDLFVNYGSVRNDGGVQPGCPVGTFPAFSREDLCSHDRSWMFYSESLRNPLGFPASLAPDYASWVAAGNNAAVTTYLGELVNLGASGNFFLTTNPTSPYARQEAGATYSGSQSRRKRGSPFLEMFQDYSS